MAFFKARRHADGHIVLELPPELPSTKRKRAPNQAVAEVWLRAPGGNDISQHEMAWAEFSDQQAARAGAGVLAKRSDRSRESAALLSQVKSLRAKYPDASTREIAMRSLPADQRGDQRAIEAKAARIRRLKPSK